jgi:glycosyltransferase involved in cell wall biosynthesis
VADLLHAWQRLAPPSRQRAELLIVGDDLAGEGAYRREMERLARELNSPARFMGFQKNVDRWLAACDLVMVPSHVEPLGNATLEAMAHRRPVIGGDVGGIPEMIVHQETGLLVPPKCPDQLAAAITRLLEDAEARTRYGAAARRRCEEMFSLEAHTRSVLAQYQIVLAPERALART